MLTKCFPCQTVSVPDRGARKNPHGDLIQVCWI